MAADDETCKKLASVPTVDIDAEGTFNYILVRISCCKPGEEDSCPDKCKNIVRGYARLATHDDILKEVTAAVEPVGAAVVTALGGGTIEHDAAGKKIKVYGAAADGIGKADHKITIELLKVVYTDYEIVESEEA